MNNKRNIVWIVLIILIIILLIIFFNFDFVKDFGKTKENQNIKIEDIKFNIGSEVEKTNPFKADVNPYNGYKNPFVE
ncbi:MAG: hypothetical protein NDI62_02465 [Burkholderiales bacterium]|nr:hypothetical protein [Burkholderiales bacterium]